MSIDELRLHRWNCINGTSERTTLNRINLELYNRTGDESYLIGINGH